MKTPASIGLPGDKFVEWRRGQQRAIRDLLFAEDRFNAMVHPTGSGKSATYMGVVAVDEETRACVVTATKTLQNQLSADFRTMGLTDMRGRQNYDCEIAEDTTAAEGKCTAGVFCEYIKKPGCDYYDQKRKAMFSRLVVTNYSYWLHDGQAQGELSLGYFPTLVLDEAHLAPDQISEFAAFELSEGDCRRYQLPEPQLSGFELGPWGARVLMMMDRVEPGGNYEYVRRAYEIKNGVSRLLRLSSQDWLLTSKRYRQTRWRWDLIDPGALAEELLFRDAQRVILASASIRRKTLAMLGVKKGVKLHEAESQFPVKRRPTYYWPVTNVSKKKMTQMDEDRWIAAMDSIIGDRLDRKGLVHCHSYDWGELIASRSKHRSCMIVHHRGYGPSITELLEEFRAAGPGVVFVSPAISTGVDFPGEECEYQIISKCPFPDRSNPLMVAREKRDRDYSAYMTAQSIVQAVGRGMRSADDQCESFVVDSNFGWLRGRYWDFYPRWFHAAVKTMKKDDRPPAPPPPLRRSKRVSGRDDDAPQEIVARLY